MTSKEQYKKRIRELLQKMLKVLESEELMFPDRVRLVVAEMKKELEHEYTVG